MPSAIKTVNMQTIQDAVVEKKIAQSLFVEPVKCLLVLHALSPFTSGCIHLRVYTCEAVLRFMLMP